jgi:hypothetical protein
MKLTETGTNSLITSNSFCLTTSLSRKVDAIDTAASNIGKIETRSNRINLPLPQDLASSKNY